MPAARLLWPTDLAQPSAVAVVLHGGREDGHDAVRDWQAAVWRMRPFERAIARAGRGRVAVASIRYAVRGWNGDEASPLVDTLAALEQVGARHPGVPVGLLGHSMGGRVALHLAADERVHAIAALAPWVDGKDRARWHPGLHALFMHGTRDRITSPRRSRAMADAMAALGADVTYRAVHGDVHGMLRQPGRWHRESAQYLVEHLTRDVRVGDRPS